MGFFSNLTGGGSRRDLRAAKAQSDADLAAGYEGGNAYYDKAYGELTPYAESGLNANRMYNEAIGLGTDAERTAAQDRYFSDPAFQAILGQKTNAMLRNLNARGAGGGGMAARAAAEAGLSGYGDWLTRLQTQGTQGGQYATTQAGIRTGQGDLRYGYGATKAGNAVNFGNAMAASRSTGINNLLGVVNAGANAVSAAAKTGAFSDIRLKRDIMRSGSLPSGLPTYFFRYLWSGKPHFGVMAHEARTLFPDAVSEGPGGFLMVDYAKIG